MHDHRDHAQAARDAAREADYDRANYHALMAVYEALVLPGYGTSVGERAEERKEADR